MNQKKDDSTCGTRPSPTVTRERLQCFIPFFFSPHVLEIAQPDYTRRDSTALGIIHTLSRIDRIFSTYLWLRREIFTATLMSSRTLGNWTIPSDHATVRLVIQKPTNRGQQGKRIPSWMSKHPVFCSLLKRLHDDHRFSTDPFCALAEFKALFLKRLRSRRFVNSHGRHLTASEQSS